MNMSEEQVQEMVDEVDEDGNGEVDFDEFKHVFTRNPAQKFSARDVIRSFALFRRPEDPPGEISTDTFIEVLKKYGNEAMGELSEEDLLKIRDEFDSKGHVNFTRMVHEVLGK